MPKSFGKRRVQVGDPVEALYRGYVADCFASLEKRGRSSCTPALQKTAS